MLSTDAGEVPLPKEVREQDATKTSVFRAGKLVYDGATGEGTERPSTEGPGQSLNEMLKWSIEHSDPDELRRRAATGAAPPSQIDKEIMDMLLGQPTVAKMRECLGKLESAALCEPGGLDEGCAALEELEYYAEDLDNALDLVKIGGLGAMRACCAFGLLAGDPDASASASAEAAAVAAAAEDAAALREAACGVLAAMVQNNPKVARSAIAAGIAPLLLALLSGGGAGVEADRVGGIGVVRKGLLALSALLRTSADASGASSGGGARTLSDVSDADPAGAAAGGDDDGGAAALAATLGLSMPTLCRLASHEDLKVRRRTAFLLASLASERPDAREAIATAADEALLTLMGAAMGDEDEDVRTQSQRLLVALCDAGGGEAAGGMAARLAAAGIADACERALARSSAASAGTTDPEEVTRLRLVQKTVGGG